MSPFLPSSPAVRRIVTDYLRRWWWVLALIVVYHLFFLAFIFLGAGEPVLIVSMHAFFAGAALAARDRAAGALRLSAVLPLSTEDRIACTRWTAIVTPGALWLAAGMLTATISALAGGGPEKGWACLKVTVFLILGTPTAFLTQTIPPVMKPGEESLQWRLAPWRSGLASAMLLFTMFGYQGLSGGSWAAWAGWLALGVSAVAGWIRARHWVAGPVIARPDISRAATTAPLRGRGHPLKLWLRDAAVGGAAIGVALGVFYLALGFLNPLLWKVSLIAQQTTFAVFFAGMASAVRVASSLRPLRAAPITAGRLAAFCMAAPMVAGLSAIAGVLFLQIVTGRIQSVGFPHLLSWFSCVLLLPLTGCALQRFSGTAGGYLLSILLCVVPGVFLSTMDGVPIAGHVLAVAAAPAVLFAWWWNRRLITRSSAIYQAMRFLPKPA